jgi:hypothetical protein
MLKRLKQLVIGSAVLVALALGNSAGAAAAGRCRGQSQRRSARQCPQRLGGCSEPCT